MTQPTILITGSTGLLGPYLMDMADVDGHVVGMARTNSDYNCDVTDRDAIQQAIQDIQPDTVIHAAAMTDVDICEQNPSAANKLNHEATANIVAALPTKTMLAIFSTIAVYPDTEGPHVEGAEDPVNIYGKTKLAGESEAMKHAKTLVIRTSMFGPSRDPRRKSLSDFVISKLTNKGTVALFDDEQFSPLHLETLAELAVAAISERITGIYNLASRKGMSKFDFGFEIARHLGLPDSAILKECSRAIPGRSLRALDMRLDPARFELAMGRRMPTLVEEIAKL